jgi:acyl-CoA synthetase (AMP-forming)/AMP-acid ligase II
MRLHQLLSESAGRLGHKTAIVAGNARHSYAELERKSDRLAATLVSRGMTAGDRVVVFMDSGVEAAVSIFAVLKAGGALAPIDPTTTADELAFVFDHSRALAILTQARLASVAAVAIGKASTVRLVVLAGGDRASCGESCVCFEEAVNRSGPVPTLASVGVDEDPAVLVYAPISFGMVEPVAMTHRHMLAAVAAASEPLAGCEDTVVLGVPSISSARSLYRLLAAIKVGATVVLERGPARVGDMSDSLSGGHLPDHVAAEWSRTQVASWDGRLRPAGRRQVEWEGERY